MRLGNILLLVVFLWSCPVFGLAAEKSGDFQAGQRWGYTSSDKARSVEIEIRSFNGQSGWVLLNIHQSGDKTINIVNQEAPMDFTRGAYHIEFLCQQDGQNDYYDVVIKPRKGAARCEVYRNSQIMGMIMGPLTLQLQQ